MCSSATKARHVRAFLWVITMDLITLAQAKSQLGVLDDEENEHIEGLINASIGRVEHAIARDIYQTQSDIPANSPNAIALDTLTPTHKATLQQATLLALSSLYSTREADTAQNLKDNPAFNALLSGFKYVSIG